MSKRIDDAIHGLNEYVNNYVQTLIDREIIEDTNPIRAKHCGIVKDRVCFWLSKNYNVNFKMLRECNIMEKPMLEVLEGFVYFKPSYSEVIKKFYFDNKDEFFKEIEKIKEDKDGWYNSRNRGVIVMHSETKRFVRVDTDSGNIDLVDKNLATAFDIFIDIKYTTNIICDLLNNKLGCWPNINTEDYKFIKIKNPTDFTRINNF